MVWIGFPFMLVTLTTDPVMLQVFTILLLPQCFILL